MSFTRLLNRWRERRALRKSALRILADPAPSVDALIKARGIIEAINERREVCRQCFQPFTFKDRSFPEWFQLRAILLIPDSQPNPMICDDCYDKVVGSYNQQWTNIGTSNSGPTNLALQKLH